jgi:hypothetical protein
MEVLMIISINKENRSEKNMRLKNRRVKKKLLMLMINQKKESCLKIPTQMTKRKKRKTVMLSKKDSRKNVSNKWQ